MESAWARNLPPIAQDVHHAYERRPSGGDYARDDEDWHGDDKRRCYDADQKCDGACSE